MPEISDLDGLTPAQLTALAGRISAKLGSAPPSPQKTSRRSRKKSGVKYLTDEETAALFGAIEAARNPRDLALFEVAYHRGLRASEVGLLQMAQLRVEAKRLYISRLKGGTSGEYVLTEREVKALRAWLRVRGRQPGPLFPSRERKPIGRRRLDQLMKHYGELAGVPVEKRHFHCLRHSCGTHLIELTDVAEVQDHLGHRDIRNTIIYAKITNRKRTELGEQLKGRW
jgi:type 1 fimbriae regulatory protein FimB